MATEYRIAAPSVRSGRVVTVPRRLEGMPVYWDNTGHRIISVAKDEYRCDIYYPVIECVRGDFRRRFSEPNKEIMKTIQACCPKSKSTTEYCTNNGCYIRTM